MESAMLNHKLIDISPQEESPLAYADGVRRGDAMILVRAALDRGNAALAFQPIVSAQNPADIIFYEGLIRIPDERGRIIPARDFMPFVENIELGRKIDAVALELGLRHLLENPDIRISLNMLARSIGYGPWSDTLARYLRRDLNLGTRLILEITESSAILVPELVLSSMKDMRKRGITFALDDFGAGTTSFRYLRDFNFDVVKVDGQFIRGVAWRGVAWRKLAIIRCWCRHHPRLRNISPCIRSQTRLKHRPMRIGSVRTV
jgi:EAL domain-containing protein (putative c-di-GMP-specific phosphodiesterase class I)